MEGRNEMIIKFNGLGKYLFLKDWRKWRMNDFLHESSLDQGRRINILESRGAPLGIIKFGGCILINGKKGKKREKKKSHEFWKKWILKEKMCLPSLIALYETLCNKNYEWVKEGRSQL